MPLRESMQTRGRVEEAEESMQIGALFLATLLATLAPAAGVRAAEAEAAADVRQASLFPRPAELEPQIRFWRAVFTQYSAHQVVLHDAVHLDKVYKVLDFRSRLDDGFSDGELAGLERIETDVELDRLRATLLRLRARFAWCIRDSGPYFPGMERICLEEDLPVELVRLPLIESCFDLRAYSKAGAAGVWQFMPKTGRLFMRVDNLVDERRDPISSTRAAARFLTRVHDMLDTWPLTITAYNHGPDGVARAVSEVGTNDIATIVRDYHGKAFGFASRNFYVEFLAALEVERDHRTYFGDLHAEPPPRVRERRLERALGIEAAARLARIGRSELASLNPALSTLVVTGHRPIPAGYRLRLPESAGGSFENRLAEFSAEQGVTSSASPRPVRVGRSGPPPTAGARGPAEVAAAAPPPAASRVLHAHFRDFGHLVRSPAGCGPIRCSCGSRVGAASSSAVTRRPSSRRGRVSRPAPRSAWSRPR